MNYHHLRYFWAVAHEGSLTRAAEQLHVSQSALSIQIKKLEAELGHPLFERRNRSLHLTEAGRIALDHADLIFATGDELLGLLQARPDARRQSLRIGVVATLSRNFQLQFLGPVLGRDDVDLVVRSGAFAELLGALETHRVDVVIANGWPRREADARFIAHAIAEQPVSLVGDPRYRTEGVSLARLLASEPLIVPSADSSIRAGFDALIERLGIHPRIAAEVDDMAMLRLLARARVGLAVVPPIVVKDELDAGILAELAQLPGLEEQFLAITIPRRFPNPLLETLIARADDPRPA
jgi:LysR family transcriptional regulator, transcriptional activator of nhaA